VRLREPWPIVSARARGGGLACDAPNRDLIWAARDILLESKGLEPRTRSTRPALRRAMAALVDLYAQFSEAKYQKVFATLYVDARDRAVLVRLAVHLGLVHLVRRRHS
jgi:hypothetical protein